MTSLLAYAYEGHGRIASETRTINGVAYVLAYSYDSSGRLSGMTYPSGPTIVYGFDALGRISQVSTTPQGGTQQIVASGIAYQPFGGVKSYTLGNGQTTTRGYDSDGRIASYSLGTQVFALNYDDASRIRMISETGNAANMNTYDYDVLDRLTSAVLPNVPFAYGYDAVGNRASKTTGSSTDTYAYGTTSNRLASITAQGGTVRNLGFDPNGSTIDDGVNQYMYDTRGRMTQSTGALGTTTYQVNALGQRVRKTNTSDDRVFVYDTKGKLIEEANPTGQTLTEYVFLGDIPVSVLNGQGVYYVHSDHLNTPRLIADSTGTTVWRWDQGEPFGNDVPNNNPSGLGAFDFPLRLPGQYFDKETALHYNAARDYDPSIGRYVESDPIALSAGVNTYAYGSASPLVYIDPDGLKVRLICRPVAGPGIGLIYDHCFVYVTCPEQGIDTILSLFGTFPYIFSKGQKRSGTPGDPKFPDNPKSPKNTYDKEIEPCGNKCCAYEKDVIRRFNGAPPELPYEGPLFNSNNFSRYLITSPAFCAGVPSDAPTSAPGLR